MRPNNALEWPVTRFTPAFGRPLNASVGGKEMIVRVIVCSLCSAFGAVATLSAAEPLSGPESTRAVAWLWTLHQSPIEMTGSRYVVDLAGMKVTADKDPNGDYAREKGEQWNSNAEVYDRLAKSFRESRTGSSNSALGVAIGQVEHSKGSGYSPSSEILVSPDGTHAVLTPIYGAITLVDLRTLNAEVLIADPSLETPLAWSPDSRFLGFPSSEKKGVAVYDVERHAIQTTLPITITWPCALAWSPNMRQFAILDLVGRRLHMSPLGLLGALSGHPDFRNDLVLRVMDLTDRGQRSAVLQSNLTEQSSYEYRIEWR